MGGQLGFGALAQGASKALAYKVGDTVYLAAEPLYRRAGTMAAALRRERPPRSRPDSPD